jgi:hypothetical protein
LVGGGAAGDDDDLGTWEDGLKCLEAAFDEYLPVPSQPLRESAVAELDTPEGRPVDLAPLFLPATLAAPAPLIRYCEHAIPVWPGSSSGPPDRKLEDRPGVVRLMERNREDWCFALRAFGFAPGQRLTILDASKAFNSLEITTCSPTSAGSRLHKLERAGLLKRVSDAHWEVLSLDWPKK